MLLTLSSTASAEESLRAREDTQVVAEVNTVAITMAEVNAELSAHLSTQRRALNQELVHKLRKQVLTSLIDRELLLQNAVKRSISVPDSTAKITRSGTQEEQELLRRDQIIRTYLSSTVFNEVRITPSDVQAELRRSPERFTVPVEVRVRQIFFPGVSSDTDWGTTRARAEDVLSRARKPDIDFSRLAKTYSAGPARARGGDMGFLTRNQLEPSIAAVVFTLQPGKLAISLPLRLDYIS